MRAASSSLSALYSNPANMAVAQLYHVGAFGQILPEARRQSYGAAVVDSLISSTGLAGGLGGVLSLQDPDGIDRQWTDVRFGLAMPLGDLFFLGLTGKYITLVQNGVGPLGQSYASGGLVDQNILQTVTFDAGMTLRATPEFSVALGGENLSNPDTALLPLMGGIGLAYITKDFGLTSDVTLEGRTYSKSNLRFQAGGEALVADRVALRAGYRFDQQLASHSLSAGVGYVDQKYSFDIALRRSVSGPALTSIVFGITVHIEALGLGPSNPNGY